MSDASKAAARKRGRDRRVSGANGKPLPSKASASKQASKGSNRAEQLENHPVKPTGNASGNGKRVPLGRKPATVGLPFDREQPLLPHIAIETIEQHDPGAFDRDSWTTPAEVIAAVLLATRGESCFEPFDVDPCSNDQSIVPASRKIALPEDGLSASWLPPACFKPLKPDQPWIVWLNPPFSDPKPWIAKARATMEEAFSRDVRTMIVGIVKMDPSTEYFRMLDPAWLILPGSRVAYGGAGFSPPFGSVLFAFSHAHHGLTRPIADSIAASLDGRAIPPAHVVRPLRERRRPKAERKWPSGGGSITPQSLASEAPHSANTRVDSKNRTGPKRRDSKASKAEGSGP